MDIQQLEVFRWQGEDEAEARKMAQDHFGPLEIILDRTDRDDEIVFYAYAVEQVKSLSNQVASYVIKLFDSRAVISVRANDDYSEFTVDIRCKHNGFLIGHHGATLDALEMIISVILNREFSVNRIILLDINGYRERRETSLIRMVKDIISEIERDHKERPVPGLLPKERKIIHRHLNNHPYLTTISIGKGRARTLYIKPREFDSTPGDDQSS
ncbi:KH domain-containing protein [bacterium]|nr:KH domain-containing protein [bacterium]